MKQLERLEQIIKEDKNTYSMQEIMEVFALTFDGYEKQSKTCKIVKSKITKGEWNSLINGITMSFFLSLHASKKPIEEALKLADTEGILGVAVVEGKTEGKNEEEN